MCNIHYDCTSKCVLVTDIHLNNVLCCRLLKCISIMYRVRRLMNGWRSVYANWYRLTSVSLWRPYLPNYRITFLRWRYLNASNHRIILCLLMARWPMNRISSKWNICSHSCKLSLYNWFLMVPSIATKFQYVNSPFFIFPSYSLHVSAPTGHPQVRYTISFFQGLFLLQRIRCTYTTWRMPILVLRPVVPQYMLSNLV
jgi:hypothetical protein